MPPQTVKAAHVRVVCDACRTASAEVCGKRDLPVMARVAAVKRFREVDWHHDPGRDHRSARSEKEAGKSGSGGWHCPTCAKRTHL